MGLLFALFLAFASMTFFAGDALDGDSDADDEGQDVTGSDGAEEIFTADGDDSISGGGGDDLVRSGDGNDSLSGGAGNDSLFSGAGDDLLIGGLGTDYLVAGEGDDALVLGGSDTGDGGSGADSFEVILDEGMTRPVEVHGFDPSVDTLRVSGTAPVEVAAGNRSYLAPEVSLLLFEVMEDGSGVLYFDLLGNPETPVASDDYSALHIAIVRPAAGVNLNQMYTSTSNIVDTSNVIFPFEQAQNVNGTDGADNIRTLNGDDIINGGLADDSLQGGAGSDSLYGGDGDDRLSANWFGDIWYDSDTYSTDDYAKKDPLTGNYPINDNLIDGGAGNDTLSGGYGANTLLGGAGDDSITSSDDYYYFSENSNGLNYSERFPQIDDPFADMLIGGGGNDTLSMDDGSVATGGNGSDTFILKQDIANIAVPTVTDFDPGTDVLRVDLQISQDEPEGAFELRDGETEGIIDLYYDDHLLAHIGSTTSLDLSADYIRLAVTTRESVEFTAGSENSG